MAESGAVQASNANLAEQLSDQEWYQNTKTAVLDLNTPADELMTLFQEAAQDGSEAKLHALNALMGMRTNMSAALSNLLKLLNDSARLIIQNLRP